MKALKTKRRKLERSDNTDSNKGQGNKNKLKDKSGTSKPQSKDTKCVHCGHINHASKDCWFSPENKGKPKPGKKSLDKTVMMTTEQLNTILQQLTPRNPKSGTRKVLFSPAPEDMENVTMYEPKANHSKVDINNFSDEDSIYLGLHTERNACFHHNKNSPKRQKLSHKTTKVVGKKRYCLELYPTYIVGHGSVCDNNTYKCNLGLKWTGTEGTNYYVEYCRRRVRY